MVNFSPTYGDKTMQFELSKLSEELNTAFPEVIIQSHGYTFVCTWRGVLVTDLKDEDVSWLEALDQALVQSQHLVLLREILKFDVQQKIEQMLVTNIYVPLNLERFFSQQQIFYFDDVFYHVREILRKMQALLGTDPKSE